MDDQSKSSLRNFIRSPQWQVVLDVKNLVIQNLATQSVLRDTNDETLRAAITKEAKIEALNNFIQEILNQAQ